MKLADTLWFLTVRLVEVLVVLLLILFMPNVPPDAKFSISYDVPHIKPFDGGLHLHEGVELTKGAEKLFEGELHGPESLAIYKDKMYTTVHGGWVVEMTFSENSKEVTWKNFIKFGESCEGFYEEKKCGRPLGLTFKGDDMYVCDAYYGLWKVNMINRNKERLISPDVEIGGHKPKLFNSLAVASNGDIYWSDSSTQFYLEDGLFDMLADGTGRLIHYDAATKKNTVLIDNLRFANGVNIAVDESFVLVNDLLNNRILRYYLEGPAKGTHDVFIDGLPGLPDNINNDGADGFIVPLVIAVDNAHPLLVQSIGPFPLLRKLVARILGLVEGGFKLVDRLYPNEFAKRGVHFVGHFESFSFLTPKRMSILHISKEGKVLQSTHGLSGTISGISDAIVFNHYLYMGSPFNHYLVRTRLLFARMHKLLDIDSSKSGNYETRLLKEEEEEKPAEVKKAPQVEVAEKKANPPQPEVKKTAPIEEKKVLQPEVKKSPPVVQEKTSPPPPVVKKPSPEVKTPQPQVKKTPEVKKTQPEVKTTPPPPVVKQVPPTPAQEVKRAPPTPVEAKKAPPTPAPKVVVKTTSPAPETNKVPVEKKVPPVEVKKAPPPPVVAQTQPKSN